MTAFRNRLKFIFKFAYMQNQRTWVIRSPAMSNIKMNGEDSFTIRKPSPNPTKWENKVKIYLDQRTGRALGLRDRDVKRNPNRVKGR